MWKAKTALVAFCIAASGAAMSGSAQAGDHRRAYGWNTYGGGYTAYDYRPRRWSGYRAYDYGPRRWAGYRWSRDWGGRHRNRGWRHGRRW